MKSSLRASLKRTNSNTLRKVSGGKADKESATRPRQPLTFPTRPSSFIRTASRASKVSPKSDTTVRRSCCRGDLMSQGSRSMGVRGPTDGDGPARRVSRTIWMGPRSKIGAIEASSRRVSRCWDGFGPWRRKSHGPGGPRGRHSIHVNRVSTRNPV